MAKQLDFSQDSLRVHQIFKRFADFLYGDFLLIPFLVLRGNDHAVRPVANGADELVARIHFKGGSTGLKRDRAWIIRRKRALYF